MGISNLVGASGKVGVEDVEFGLGTETDVFTVPAVGYPGGVSRKRLPNLDAGCASVVKGAYYVSNLASITDHSAASGANYTAYNMKRVIDLIGASQAVMTAPSGVYNMGGSTLVIPANIFFNPQYGFTVTNGTLSVLGPQMPATVSSLGVLGKTPGAYDGQTVNILGDTYPGDGGHGAFKWNASSVLTADGVTIVAVTGVSTGRWIRQYSGDIRVTSSGADHSAKIQAALNYAATVQALSSASSITVDLDSAGAYTLSSGITIPARVQLDAHGSKITYTGTGTAVTVGHLSNDLNYLNGFLNFVLWLTQKMSVGVLMRANTQAKVNGYIEGIATPYDNTRTNIGVIVDGANISSFLNVISVVCNHIHESFRVTTTGSTQPTAQLFLNCSAQGDQTTDNTSIGWNFTDVGIAGFADGTKFVGCNIESVNKGIYFGSGCVNIDVNARWEVATTSTSRTVVFHTNTKSISLKGAGIDSALIGAVAGGIEGFANGNHYIFDCHGNTRSGGNDSSFAGLTPPIRAFGEKDFLLKSNAPTFFQTTDGPTGTASFKFQPGYGSIGAGAYLRLDAHGVSGGHCYIGPSYGGGGNFHVTGGMGGSDRFLVTPTAIDPGADNAFSAGEATKRYTVVYATNGTINTSDRREKNKIDPIDEAILQAWSEVNFYQFAFNSGLDSKMHFGVIAQEIVEVFNEHGLNAEDYGIVTHDVWVEDGVEKDRYGVNYNECVVLELALLRSKTKVN